MRRSISAFAGAIAMATIATAHAQSAPDALRPNVISCTPVRTAAQLQGMLLAESYCLENDIDLASIKNFTPIGDDTTPFTGNFFGNNHTIRNLTIDSNTMFVGLFGVFTGATVRDVKLVGANIRARNSDAKAGGLIGTTGLSSGAITISNVSVSGSIRCVDDNSVCGGIAGQLSDSTLTRSWSSADVTAGIDAGGIVGIYANGTITDSFATGSVACTSKFCAAGGLAGQSTPSAGRVDRSFATGAVTAGASSVAGGLIGFAQGPVSHSFATGAVTVGSSGVVGGLIAETDGAGAFIDQCFSVGSVLGFGINTAVGGLVGDVFGGPVTNSYWDTTTSGQGISDAGTGLTTMQLRAALPAGFDPSFWAINPTRSYPIPNDPDLAFNAPLATVVMNDHVQVSVPISQRDVTQYLHKPNHANQASLATVDTMIARAVGLAQNVSQLRAVKIDRYFWHDATQRTTFVGPITMSVRLERFKPVAPAADLTPVVNILNGKRLAILRGSYTTASGAKATHWMLATLFTKEGNRVGVIAANDPWTGTQVAIDPHTKTVVSPDFPLAHFKVDGFQPVTLLPLEALSH